MIPTGRIAAIFFMAGLVIGMTAIPCKARADSGDRLFGTAFVLVKKPGRIVSQPRFIPRHMLP